MNVLSNVDCAQFWIPEYLQILAYIQTYCQLDRRNLSPHSKPDIAIGGPNLDGRTECMGSGLNIAILNPWWPGIKYDWKRPSWDQLITCRLFCAESLPGTIPRHCQWDIRGNIQLYLEQKWKKVFSSSSHFKASYYSDVMWMSWYIKSSATPLLVQSQVHV